MSEIQPLLPLDQSEPKRRLAQVVSMGDLEEGQERRRPIPLTQGQFAIVDDSDFDQVMKHKWHAVRRPNGGFYTQRTLRVVRVNGRRVIQQMAQLILHTEQMVDHRDGNGLNNTRRNLRPCTPLENTRNKPAGSNNKSGFKGVYPTVKTKGNWSAAIYLAGKQSYLGSFKTKEDAARAYDAEALKLFGSFARLNFPTAENPVTAQRQPA